MERDYIIRGGIIYDREGNEVSREVYEEYCNKVCNNKPKSLYLHYK